MILSRNALIDIFDHNVISNPMHLHIEKKVGYRPASHSEIEAALSDFHPGKWIRDRNDCADIAAKCLGHLLTKLPGRAVFKFKFPLPSSASLHYLCGFIDIEGRVISVEPAHVSTNHPYIFQWPGPYQLNERVLISMLDMP